MNRKVLTVALTLALLGFVFASPVWASEAHLAAADQVAEAAPSGGAGVIMSTPTEMTVTVVRPVEIPGHTLEPGQYIFRMNDSENTVAVSKLGGAEFYGNYFTIPATRNHAGDTAIYTEPARGGVDRIASWYFPGELNGHSFTYPKAKHVQMAKASVATH